MASSSSSTKVGLRLRQLCIVDRIYDHILLPPLVARVLDTPEVQRLRTLHQLGGSSYVFPTATHTRFEHSIGVSYMAGKMLSHFALQQPELGLTEEEDVWPCMLAGLLHDVGHGPFSHLFEDVIATRCQLPGGFCHEAMSDRLAKRALKGIVSEEQQSLILGLMHGSAPPSVPYRDLIANASGGVDVDRVDYLTRDCVMCFGRPALDTRVKRLLFTSKLCLEEEETGNVEGGGDAATTSATRSRWPAGRWQLGFETKMALSLHELFALRAKLHRSVYQHPVTKAIGHMIGDAFELAAPYFKVDGQHTLLECVQDEELFLQLGDWILPAMEAQRGDPRLKPAQDLLKRLRQRDIYHKVFSKTLNLLAQEHWEHMDWEAAILAALPPAASGQPPIITRQDFIVDIVHVHYGKGKRNPVEDVLFFNPKKPTQKPMRLSSRSSSPPPSSGGGGGGGSVAAPPPTSSENNISAFHSQLPSLLFEERTVFVFERRHTNGALAKACEKMASDPQVAPYFVAHEIPFQN